MNACNVARSSVISALKVSIAAQRSPPRPSVRVVPDRGEMNADVFDTNRHSEEDGIRVDGQV